MTRRDALWPLSETESWLLAVFLALWIGFLCGAFAMVWA